MRGISMALESVVKWIILIAVAVVVINVIVFFSDEIKEYISGYTGDDSFEPQIIEMDEFSTSQLMTYMRSCWDKTGERFEKDAVCYILRGDMTSVDSTMLQEAVEGVSIDTSRFSNSKGVAIVRFQNVGNKIIVES